MPVPGSGFKREVMLRFKMAANASNQDYRQNDRANRNVEAVEPRQHKKCRAIHPGAQGKTELAVGVDILTRLQHHKDCAQRYGGCQPQDQFAAIVILYGPVRNRHCDTGRQ